MSAQGPSTQHKVIDGGIYKGVRWVTCKAPVYGAINGYVKLPAGHPWQGLEPERINVAVHGGLTYARDGWIGFDTLHLGDIWPGDPRFNKPRKPGDHEWTAAEVAREANKLARAVAEVATL